MFFINHVQKDIQTQFVRKLIKISKKLLNIDKNYKKFILFTFIIVTKIYVNPTYNHNWIIWSGNES